MGYEVYGDPSAGLCGRFCLRDPQTGKCFRDALGNLLTFPDAATAEAAKPVAVKKVKEAEVVDEAAAVMGAPAKFTKVGK